MKMSEKDTEKSKDIESLTNIAIEANILLALREINNIKIDYNEIENTFNNILNETNIAKILIFSSFLEEYMIRYSSIHLFGMNKKGAFNEVYGGNGPLSTFNNRLIMMNYLGWISENTFRKISAFRKLRNEFAHGAYKIDIKTQKVRSFITTITAESVKLIEKINKIENLLGIFNLKTNLESAEDYEKHLVISFALILNSLIKDMVILPICTKTNNKPNLIIERKIENLEKLDIILLLIILSTMFGKDTRYLRGKYELDEHTNQQN